MHRLVEEIERVESRFNQMVVRRRGEIVDLDVAGATFASFHPRRLLSGYSWDAIAFAALLGPSPPLNVLLLGLGGGTCLRPIHHLSPTTNLVGVELDPSIVDIAERHLGLKDLPVKVEVGDADKFLMTSKDTYDVIIDDLFVSGADDVTRTGDVTNDRLDAITARLSDDGIFVANFITDWDHRAVFNAARDVVGERFETVRTVSPPRGLNTILVGGKSLIPSSRLRNRARDFREKTDRDHWRKITSRRVIVRL